MQGALTGDIRRRLREILKVLLCSIIGTLAILVGTLLWMPFDERVLAHGVVLAERDTHLHARTEGILGEVHVREGQNVTKGQPVITLDATAWRNELQRIDLRIAQARCDLKLQQVRFDRTANLPLPKEFWHLHEELAIAGKLVRQCKVELNRSELMNSKGVLSQQEMERVQLALAMAESEEIKTLKKLQILQQGLEKRILNEAEAELARSHALIQALEVERELCLHEIDRCVVRSPEAGVLTLLGKRRPGEKVERGETLAHIAHGEPVRVELFAGEHNYHRVQTGQRVLMRSNAFDPLRYGYVEGNVIRADLEPEPKNAQDRHPLYRVIASVSSAPQHLTIGSTVEARIIIRRVRFWELFLPNTERNP